MIDQLIVQIGDQGRNVIGDFAQAGLQLQLLADILRQHEKSDHGVVTVPLRLKGHLQPPALWCGHRVVLPCAKQSLMHVTLDMPAIFVTEYLAWGLAEDLGGRLAIEGLEFAVGEAIAKVGIYLPNQCRHVIGNHFQLAGDLLDLATHPFALGDHDANQQRADHGHSRVERNAHGLGLLQAAQARNPRLTLERHHDEDDDDVGRAGKRGAEYAQPVGCEQQRNRKHDERAFEKDHRQHRDGHREQQRAPEHPGARPVEQGTQPAMAVSQHGRQQDQQTHGIANPPLDERVRPAGMKRQADHGGADQGADRRSQHDQGDHRI